MLYYHAGEGNAHEDGRKSGLDVLSGQAMRNAASTQHPRGGSGAEPQDDIERKCRAVHRRRQHTATANQRNHHQRRCYDAVHGHVGQLAHEWHDDESTAHAEQARHQAGQRSGRRQCQCGGPRPVKRMRSRNNVLPMSG